MNMVEREKRKKIIMDIMQDKHYVPMKIKELAIILNVPKENRDDLQYVLDELISEGKIGLTKRGKYGIGIEEIHVGVFCATAKGFGFVSIEGFDDDVYIPARDTLNAFDGDKVQLVMVNTFKRGARKEGRIIKIVERALSEIVGTYKKSKNFGFVVPDNSKIGVDLYIPAGCDLNAGNNDKVVAEITDYGSEGKKPEGEIKEIIGGINDPGVDIVSIIKDYGIEEEFPDEVIKQCELVPSIVTSENLELKSFDDSRLGKSNACADKKSDSAYARYDLRKLQTVTIDGEDAKDLDDAISIEKHEDGYLLGVHIADVSEYVREDTPLDKEAKKRGTSVYLVDRVIPMLPKKLSNGICSLNAGEDRLALSCIMEFDKKGNLLSHEICETLINVDKRMSYNGVQATLDGEEAAREENKDFLEMFDIMLELSRILRNKRFERGAINFDSKESKIILDENKKVVEVKPYDRCEATMIIEDFMLAANETVAEEYFWAEIPFVYRSHEEPDEEKIRDFGIFINNFGYSLRPQVNKVHSKELQKILENVKGKPEEAVVNRLLLRSMKRANYTTASNGHFGLAARYYCHFTSPIRRYPDLQIHRIIKENLHGNMDENRLTHYINILPEVVRNSSVMERRANDAEYDTDKLKKAEYMLDKIGNEYEGIISGLTSWGIYVELYNTVEGMVRLKDIKGDFYDFYEEEMIVRGEHTGITYKLGQTVNIKVMGADKNTKTVDFKFV